MNPTTYAALYGPYQPPRRRPHRGQAVVTVLAGMLWAVTFASLALLTFVVGMAALWGAADGTPVGDLVLTFFGIIIGAAAVLAALAFAPGVRRLAPASRLLLLGALACPVPTVYAIMVWARIV
ncbi:hypothetical protein A8W25_31605 [Streptomyces sp. ERV7]|uniref:hypothetical protein n=1 Tax=Streptomyces sp. ERV7 TaxID=1322334 RepID=UPI0007F4617B|nr:hypothetical protein [Streptomyces sp. ERV7]OAR26645.1 hypothetical protein A8W25_31605 [Streptomyces sp. ERV7]